VVEDEGQREEREQQADGRSQEDRGVTVIVGLSGGDLSVVTHPAMCWLGCGCCG
jgi:hypothetical protein